ncbi:HlyC/CorC family transporter [Priestia aryabhattai]|uniref:hemolysin family protein n=1 Tax=Priestia TaxID=2800373 RepID=UPI000B200903|nr:MULTISPECIES: hemolysin family protein [Priestia]MBY0094888.1 HlyC/CorC family transporter [Priestia aryabhattai]MBY0104666.1 HlyC/CorC family transporter [Priestia aryabhattai]MCM3308710.1 hemolysin family protein [Priestia megaterium]
MDIINLLLVAVLIGLTGFFVATEFAIVKVRSSKIDQLVAEGKKGAVSAKKVITHLDEYLSACQLGITVTAMGLGVLGEPTVERLLSPIFIRFDLNESITHLLSFGIAFIVMTYLHVVVGELAPKTFSIQKAEAVTLLFSAPIIWFYKIMYPFIWILNGSARILVGMFGLKPASEHELAHSEEELRLLLAESYKSGAINQSELKYVNNIFEFDERLAKEIMIPRTEIITISEHDTIDAFLEMAASEQYTRYPVTIDGDKDQIIGIVNIKEILSDVAFDDTLRDKLISPYVKPVIQVIESYSINKLLRKMQKERIHMTILLDEYGGTAGLVTVEDILEEIVGEIRDEFDSDEVLDRQRIGESHYIFNGKVLVEDVNTLMGTNIENDEIDTIGGWILSQKIDVKLNEVLVYNEFEFTVKELDGRHIQTIEVVNRQRSLSLTK